MVIDVSNILDMLLNVHRGMSIYPKGLYVPYMLEPYVMADDLVDCNHKAVTWDDISDVGSLYSRDGAVMYEPGLNADRHLSVTPYVPYRPMKILIEYVEKYLDHKIADRDIAITCPILGYKPIIHESGYIGITDLIKATYDITLNTPIDALTDSLDYILDNDVPNANKYIYSVQSFGKSLYLEIKGTVNDLRYELILEEYTIDEGEDFFSKVETDRELI